jgi:hypothetical protein
LYCELKVAWAHGLTRVAWVSQGRKESYAIARFDNFRLRVELEPRRGAYSREVRSPRTDDSVGERVFRRLALTDLVRERDLLEVGESLRFLISAREPFESAPEDGERLRRRSLTGLADLEVFEGERRRRRGGVRDRDRDTLGAGELDLTGGERDVEVCLDSLLLSRVGDSDLFFLPPDRLAGGDLLREGDARRVRRGGDGERRVRRLGGDRDGSDEGERRVRRGGGDAERLPEGERRRSRDLSPRPPRPRPRPRPPSGM